MILSGDRWAARELYDRYAKRVYRLSLRMARDDELAREITQETFLKVYRSLNKYRGESAVGTWIHRVALTTALDVLRRERRIGNRESSLEEGGDFISPSSEPPEGLRSRLLMAIDKLSEELCSVLMLHDVEGYRHREIAEMLDIPEGTSKSRLSQARVRLRGLLEAGSEKIENK